MNVVTQSLDLLVQNSHTIIALLVWVASIVKLTTWAHWRGNWRARPCIWARFGRPGTGMRVQARAMK